MRSVACAAFFLCSLVSAFQGVSEDVGNDVTIIVSPLGTDLPSGDGSLAHPVLSLSRALTVAGNASAVTLRLLSGTYDTAQDRNLTPTKPSKLQIVGEAGKDETIVDLAAFGSPFLTIGDRLSQVRLSGITIKNGWGTSAVIVSASSARSTKERVFSSCSFRNNSASTGGAMFLGSAVHVEDCDFESNVGTFSKYGTQGGGVAYVAPGIPGQGPYFSNCTFRNNSANVGGALFLGSAAHLEGCDFQANTNIGNEISQKGGAVYVASGITGLGPNLTNCTFRNNIGHLGGAVLLDSGTRVSWCRFEANAAFGGGAIWSTGNSLISNSFFGHNSATRGDGGAVRATSHVQLERCTFEGNSALNAGAVLVVGDDTSARVSNCTFLSNSATFLGGAMIVSSASIALCSFQGNSAVTAGGVRIDGDVMLSRCIFSQNMARRYGGALDLASAGAQIERCWFEGNAVVHSIGGGGAVSAWGVGKGPLMSNCHFRNNWASGNAGGGAVLLQLSGQVVGCSFEGNRALSPNTGGGGIFIDAAGNESSITHCHFRNNSAIGNGGGGAIFLNSVARVLGCYFESNVNTNAAAAGGAVYVDGGVGGDGPWLSQCVFVKNIGTGFGGAVYLGSTTILESCHFEQNMALNPSSGGGAIYVNAGIEGTGPLMRNNTFRNNSAVGGGGAVALNSIAHLENCTFLANTAPNPSRGGGAVTVHAAHGKGVVLFSNCSFYHNWALQGGGAVVLDSPGALLHRCLFEHNAAPMDSTVGGAVFVVEGDSDGPFLSECTFRLNFANFGGGAIGLNAAAIIISSTFEDNQALGSGGAVFLFYGLSGSGMLISTSTFRNNSVHSAGGSVYLGSLSHLRHCTFEFNAARGPGGAVFVEAAVTTVAEISNCSFKNNTAAIGGAVGLASSASVEGCRFEANVASTGGAAAVASNTTFLGCIFTNNHVSLPSQGAGVWVALGGYAEVLSCALCAAHDVIECDHSQGPTLAIVATDLPPSRAHDVVSPRCHLTEALGIPFSQGNVTSMFGAVCGPLHETLLYTTTTGWRHFIALSAMLFSTKGATLAVSPPLVSSSEVELTSPRVFEDSAHAVIPSTGYATLNVSIVVKGSFIAGTSPNFGVRFLSPPDVGPHVATPFFIKVRAVPATLSLHRSAVDVVGFPFAWDGLVTLLLVRLRDELGRPFPAKIGVRIDGKDAICGEETVTASQVCSITFHGEGKASLELFGEDGESLGTLKQQVTVVSLGWPIAGAVLLLLAGIAGTGLAIVRAWRRRRQRVANKLLANYVGLEQQLSGKMDDPSEDYLIDKSFLIPFSAIDVRRDIAAGAAGSVSLGTWKGTSVAVKRLYTLPMCADESEYDQRAAFIKELAMHKSLRHPNVVQLMGICLTPLCIVMEFMERGSLFRCLQERETLDMPWLLRLRCALDVSRAMSFLHSEGILHRDLKSLNVLVNEDWRCKVADFDQSRADSNILTGRVGTVLWSAPEVLEGKGEYGKAADVYSFGIIMWECWTRLLPFQDTTGRRDIPSHILAGGRPVFPPSLGEPPQPFECIIRRCWDEDPTVRPRFDMIVEELEAASLASLGAEDGEHLSSADGSSWNEDTATSSQGRSRATSWFSRVFRRRSGGSDLKEPLIPMFERSKSSIPTIRESLESLNFFPSDPNAFQSAAKSPRLQNGGRLD